MEDKFDKNNCALIGCFLDLKEECYSNEKKLLEEGSYGIYQNNIDFIHLRSFYSDFRDICNLPLFFLINEEISNSHDRDYLPPLMNQVLNDESFYVNFSEKNKKTKHYEDITELMTLNYNEIVGSMMLDFTVSAFSAFERWVDKLYGISCCNHKEKIIRSRIKKISKQIEKYDKSKGENSIECISQKILLIPGNFISFPDKITGISELINKDAYTRKLHEDKNIIDFLSKKRNTIHNLGKHTGHDATIIVDGIKHSIFTGEYVESPSWINSLNLYRHLIKIYTALLLAMPNQSDFIEGIVEIKYDPLAIAILTACANDFINQIERDNESFSSLMIEKFGLSDRKSKIFTKDLIKHEKKVLSEGDIFALLLKRSPE